MTGGLARVGAVARESGEPALADEAEAWAGRLRQGRFYVAVLGQFKRGKSSLVNALIGTRALPTGVVPVTSVVTCVRYSESPVARVRQGGVWREVPPEGLSAWVSEAENPGNRLGVDAVDVGVPSALLAKGLCLVDTPGIGSVSAENTAATRDFVPQIDATLFVVGADPPISGDEADLLVAAGLSEVLVVLNKADRVSAADLAAARAFTERVVADRLGRAVPVVEVSAVEAMDHVGPPRDWGELVDTLIRWRDAGRPALVAASEVRGVRVLGTRLLARLDQRREALELPLHESESRIAALRQSIHDADEALRDLGARLAAEQERFARALFAEAERFVASSFPAAEAKLRAAIDAATSGVWDVARTATRAIARRDLEAWRARFVPEAERAYAEAMTRFTGMVEGFLSRVAEGDPNLRGIAGLGPEDAFRVPSRFYVHELRELEAVGISLPGRARVTAARAASAHLRRLLESNATLLVGDLDERMLESRRRLEADVRAHLREIVVGAERALEDARERHAAGAEAVDAERTRIRAWHAEIAALVHGPAEGA